ncbi:hypothetical protein [Phycicoccus sonneratiae]|uniref:Secreted protein n=1 Tax=Phycicoccus sonneratiae TaxID=2807628 RepID=A0ABS2CM14_9MICO|nr:hypothetical protein [Phycicoccus sonneraticus]MBM6400119.1 hypothetical protein [Phycicoccus sonneraticus]
MSTSRILRRPALGLLGAVCAGALVLSATSAVAAGPDSPNGVASGKAAPAVAAISAAFPPGSELQYVAVAPCRIIDTRVSGGALVNGQRTFDATLASYATQGGKAGSCGIPDIATSVQLNLGAISRNGTTSDVRGWATGTAEPNASLVNYNPSGPVANMVNLKVNSSGQFNLKTPGAAHLFVDVAGYYVKPLYAAVSSGGSIYSGISSGVTSVARTGTGRYTVTFERDVQQCAATASSITWANNLDVSPDVGAGGTNTVTVGIADTSNTAADGYFVIGLTC